MMRFILLINLFIIWLFFPSCNEVVDFSYDDAQRQPWLFSFIKDHKVLEGTYNYNTDVIKVYLEVKNDSLFFMHSDSIAYDGKWKISYYSDENRVYVNNFPFNSGEEDVVILKASKIQSNVIEITVY